VNAGTAVPSRLLVGMQGQLYQVGYLLERSATQI
jgi:hypothetical protein